MPPQDSTIPLPAGKVCGVYAIENTVNGRVYIGSSVGIRARWWDHRSRLRFGRHANRHLQRAWDKYGAESFVFRLVAVTAPEARRVAEAAIAAQYPPSHLYNHMVPSESRSIMAHSDEAKRRIGLKSLGHTLAADARQRISDARRGKPLSLEHRAKLSAAHIRAPRRWTDAERQLIGERSRGRKMPPEAIEKTRAAKLGKPRSPETRQTLSAALKGRTVPTETLTKRSETWRKRREAKEHDNGLNS